MNKIRIFGRSITDAFKNVFRNFSLSLASISCISITLVLVAFSIILSYNVNNFTSDIEKDMTIIVFVNNKATHEQSDEIGEKINNLSNVIDVAFQSKEDIKADLIKDENELKDILSQYDKETNPLQDTYLVKVKDIEKIGNTAKAIKKFENVATVKYGEGMVEELVKIFDIVKNITYVVVVALILVTAFLISNTIKITIQNRKREIEIMRLVGASNSFIKLPYFFEGIILGFLGTILPIMICGYGYVYLYDVLDGQLFTAVIKLVNPNIVLLNVILITLGVGVVVGAIGSYRAVRRYLKI